MKAKFISEAVIGLVIIISVLLFGERGLSAIALIALFPFINRLSKIKGDEREMLIHYRTGNIALGLAVLFVIIIYYFENFTIGKITIESIWMPLTIGSIIFAHGFSGLFVLMRE